VPHVGAGIYGLPHCPEEHGVDDIIPFKKAEVYP